VTSTPVMQGVLPWLVEPLRQAVLAQRGHALLVHGGEGAGQWPFALELARAWLCEGRPEDRPDGLACGRCASCHLVRDDQVHPDLCVLLPESLHVRLGWWQRDDEREKIDSGARKPSEWIKIEQVRAAIAFANQTRSRARPKVIVIHPAERLQPIAASALLKLLEEPQGGLRLILASADAASLLPTVRSRCQALTLPAPQAAQAAR
jgi:DNA polymerase III subunit delta'